MTKKAAFYTLGCKVNQYETHAMEKMFQNDGYEIVPFDGFADVYIVNTCTVTGVGDKKSRQMLRRAKAKNPSAVIAAVGCLAQTDPKMLESLGCVDVIIGTNQKGEIVNLIHKFEKENTPVRKIENISQESRFEDTPIENFEGRQRAFIKIQEGCNKFCSYCIIPYARGRSRSRDEESILNEVNALCKKGFCEVVLTGIHVSSYGNDTGTSLAELLCKISEISEIKRIRLSSIDPNAFTDEFIYTVSSLPKVCPHFHISLQSGSDVVLKKMNRRYTSADYLDVLAKLRAAVPDVSVTTDIITGFPYESEKEFENTLNFVKKARLSGVHVFPYSERRGTPAVKFAESVPKDERARRAHVLSELAEEYKNAFAAKFVGRTLDVLFEQKNKADFYEGFTPNYIKVTAKSDADVSGQILPVLIEKVQDGALSGKITSGFPLQDL